MPVPWSKRSGLGSDAVPPAQQAVSERALVERVGPRLEQPPLHKPLSERSRPVPGRAERWPSAVCESAPDVASTPSTVDVGGLETARAISQSATPSIHPMARL